MSSYIPFSIWNQTPSRWDGIRHLEVSCDSPSDSNMYMYRMTWETAPRKHKDKDENTAPRLCLS